MKAYEDQERNAEDRKKIIELSGKHMDYRACIRFLTDINETIKGDIFLRDSKKLFLKRDELKLAGNPKKHIDMLEPFDREATFGRPFLDILMEEVDKSEVKRKAKEHEMAV